MSGLDHFSYLVDDVEQEFFQKAAEEIAVETKDEPAITPVPEIPVRFQKLAALVYQSNHHGLTKQACEGMFDEETMGSYENILNKVAAAAYWEPLGMTESAADFLAVLEEAGVDEEELTKFAGYIFEDTIGADALIEASMEKEAGDSRPIEEIYDELVKEALPAVLRSIGGAGRWLGRNLAGGEKGVQALKGISSRVGKAVRGEVGKRGPGLLERVGRSIRAEGVRPTLKRPFSALAGKVRGVKRRVFGRVRAGGLEARRGRLNELRKEMMSLRSQLRAAAPGTGQSEQLGTQIQALNRRIAAQRERVRGQIGKIRGGQTQAGVEKVPGGAPKAPPKTPGSPDAPAPPKADAPKTAPPPKTETPSATSGLEKGEIEAGAKRLHERGSRYGEPERGRFGSRYVGPEDKAGAGARKGSYREKKTDTRGGKKGPDEGPAPERPPASEVEGKGMGVMDAWSKWGKEGWGGLSEIEKSRLIRAGVAGGGGLVAYKTVFGD